MLVVSLFSSVPDRGKGHGDQYQGRSLGYNAVVEENSSYILDLGAMSYIVLWPSLQLQRELMLLQGRHTQYIFILTTECLSKLSV